MTDTPRIKIFSRSFDLRLYRLSEGLYEGIGCCQVHRMTDCSADGYFYRMLADEDCDIAVNIDEDAFITDPQAVNDLVELMLEKGYANIGCPDAGEGLPRSGNPVVTNPFFNILNLSLIRTKFDMKALKRYDEGIEPYYRFFLWLADNFETLYLPAERHPDGTSTIVRDLQGRKICQHSWFARFYSVPGFLVRMFGPLHERQKDRIDALVRESFTIRHMSMPHFSASDLLTFAADKLLRWAIKIPQRISRWPHKLKTRIVKR